MSVRPLCLFVLHLYDLPACTGGIIFIILNTTLTPASAFGFASTDTEEGGETIFPMSGGWANPAAAASLADASPCARGKVGAKAKMVRVQFCRDASLLPAELTHEPCRSQHAHEAAAPCRLFAQHLHFALQHGVGMLVLDKSCAVCCCRVMHCCSGALIQMAAARTSLPIMQHALCSRDPSGQHLCGSTPDPTTVGGWHLLTWQQGVTVMCQAVWILTVMQLAPTSSGDNHMHEGGYAVVLVHASTLQPQVHE